MCNDSLLLSVCFGFLTRKWRRGDSRKCRPFLQSLSLYRVGSLTSVRRAQPTGTVPWRCAWGGCGGPFQRATKWMQSSAARWTSAIRTSPGFSFRVSDSCCPQKKALVPNRIHNLIEIILQSQRKKANRRQIQWNPLISCTAAFSVVRPRFIFGITQVNGV